MPDARTPVMPRALVLDERPARAQAMVAVLHAAGVSAVVDDGDPRTRRAFLPHVAVLLGGEALAPDPILDEMARLRRADVLRPGEPIAQAVERVRAAAERARRFEAEARRRATELRASTYALRGLAYAPVPLRVRIEGDDPVTLELHRGRVHAASAAELHEALTHLRGARLRVSQQPATRLPACGSFRRLLVETPVRLRSDVVPRRAPITGFRSPSRPPGVERLGS
ncbi:MAG: hypothetical protein VYE22_08235 [Myxococcota bacterium]|nr:hypothetical protein [Myxococcota bacterium]